MKFDCKGLKSDAEKTASFVTYLQKIADNSLWEYNGLIVEIDPTIDYNAQNVLVRWTDIQEGFNDKVIYDNLEDFKNNFKMIHA